MVESRVPPQPAGDGREILSAVAGAFPAAGRPDAGRRNEDVAEGATMKHTDDEGRPAAEGGPSVAGVAGRLALYVLPGAVSAMVVWEVLSELLSGDLPQGRIAWVAAALLVVLAAVVAALRRHVASRE